MARGQSGARGAAAAARTEETISHPDGTLTDEHGEVIHGDDGAGSSVDRLLEMVTITPAERDLATDDADLPILDFETTAEAKGGNLTDAGFAKLMPGFRFRGYVLRSEDVPCDPRYGVAKPVLDDKGLPVIDPQTKQPMLRKVQEVYVMKGTARVPVKGAAAGTFGEVKGRMRIPSYARIQQPIAENQAREKDLTEKARRASPNAPAVRIPLEIVYVGQGPDSETKDGQARSGAHIFEVKRLRAIAPEPA